MLNLSEIFIYPIKSLGGISFDSTVVEERGLKFDRRWMLVDEHGRFLTQREHSQMALINVSITKEGLFVKHKKNNSSLHIPSEPQTKDFVKVIIWDDLCSAVRISKEIDMWFSDLLGFKCSLIYMPDEQRRLVEKKYIEEEHIVSFADAYPYLIIGQSSLDDLNARLKTALPMNRFRPNFVFTGGNPYEEDNWKEFIIGNVKFKAVKPCARCIITTTNQDTAERNNEPLKSLSEYRKVDNKIMFGMNVISKSKGVVNVGDRIFLTR